MDTSMLGWFARFSLDSLDVVTCKNWPCLLDVYDDIWCISHQLIETLSVRIIETWRHEFIWIRSRPASSRFRAHELWQLWFSGKPGALAAWKQFLSKNLRWKGGHCKCCHRRVTTWTLPRKKNKTEHNTISVSFHVSCFFLMFSDLFASFIM